jgi:hypothetical protein
MISYPVPEVTNLPKSLRNIEVEHAQEDAIQEEERAVANQFTHLRLDLANCVMVVPV